MSNSTLSELSIELTNQCGLACIHCSSGSSPKRAKGELEFNDHKRLLRDAATLGATTLSLSGGNPLLYPMLVQLVELAVDQYGYKKILIYTTGHNANGANVWMYSGVHALMKIPQVTWVASLHSDNSWINDAIMNTPGALKDIKKSLRWLLEKGQETEIHMVPMKPNYKQIPTVRDLCAVLGVKKMSLLRFVPQTRGKAHKDALDMGRQEFLDMQLIIKDELLREHTVQLRLGCPIDFRHAIGELPAKAKQCHAGDDLMLVRPTGAVHPCAAWKSLPADSNVKTSSLAEIWQTSPVFQAIRQFKAGDYKLVGGCVGCDFLDSCKAGCPAQRLHALSSTSMDDLTMSISDPLCPRGDGHVFIDLDHKKA